MLDPLSALSLASSIIQFTDFVIHLVEVFHNINRSGDNLTDTTRAYSAYATDLANNVSRIRRALLPLDGIAGSNTPQQHKLARLADDCMRAAEEMNRTLNQLRKLRNENSWDKFIVAVKQEWNKNRLDSMREKLSLVKQNAESEILLNVSEKIDALLERQAQISGHLDDSTNSIFNALKRNQQFTADILMGNTDAIVSLHRSINAAVHSNINDAKEEIIKTVQLLDWAFTSANWDVSKRYNVSDSLPRIEESIKADVQAKERFKARVKATLVFPSMPERLEEIPEAHQRTFRWVYDPLSAAVRWDNFVDWLRGKPGSGKSCLMKYLYDNPRNEALLKTWSQGVPVVKAGFFFWNAGTKMQKSQSGLLRSILFQILGQHPSLIPIAYPRQWDSYQTKFAVHDVSIDQPSSLGGTELPNAMVRIVTQTSYPLRLCLFIDGLDEFDGDHAEIVELFKVIASVPTTKVVVSSRPWPIFTNAFASYPGLVLHDLTRRDIQEYISERLGESAGIKKLQSSEPEEAQLIINEVVEKSAGVFLWVRIVVTSLLTGLTNDDRLAHLQQRLRALPDELEELYLYLLKRVDPFYLKQALQLVSIVQNSRQRLSSLLVSIADEGNIEKVLEWQPSKMPEDEVVSRCETIEKKIQSWCLGLLECHTYVLDPAYSDNSVALEKLIFYCQYNVPLQRVQFMHRTVKDFFDRLNINEEFREGLRGETFRYDAHSALAMVQLALLKRIFGTSRFGAWASAYPTFWALIKECFYHAEEVERTEKKTLTSILDNLNQTAQYHYDSSRAGPNHWSPTWIHTHPSFQAGPRYHSRRAMFMALVIKEPQLELYIVDQIENRQSRYASLTQDEKDFLLAVSSQKNPLNVRICRSLLEDEADPNAGDPSSWHTLLRSRSHLQRNLQDEFGTDNDIIEYFIRKGADLSKCVPIGNDKYATPTPASELLLHRGCPRIVFMILERGVEPADLWLKALQFTYQDLFPTLEADTGPSRVRSWIGIFELLLNEGASPLLVASITQRAGSKMQLRDISVLTITRERSSPNGILKPLIICWNNCPRT